MLASCYGKVIDFMIKKLDSHKKALDHKYVRDWSDYKKLVLKSRQVFEHYVFISLRPDGP